MVSPPLPMPHVIRVPPLTFQKVWLIIAGVPPTLAGEPEPPAKISEGVLSVFAVESCGEKGGFKTIQF